MLALRPAVPADAPTDGLPASPGALLRDALRRAADAARLGEAARDPRFLARPLAQAVTGAAGETVTYEVLVVCDVPSPGERAVRVERALTAAQRYMLSLWTDGFDARWEAPPESARASFAGGELAVGRVLVSGPPA